MSCEHCVEKEAALTRLKALVECLQHSDSPVNHQSSPGKSVEAATSSISEASLQQHQCNPPVSVPHISSSKHRLAVLLQNWTQQTLNWSMTRLRLHHEARQLRKGFKLLTLLKHREQNQMWVGIQQIKVNSQFQRNNLKSRRPQGQGEDNRSPRRNIFLLTQELQKAKFETERSKMALEESLRRQEIENRKKKSSLEMLAQEIAEKSERIEQLEAILKSKQIKQSEKNILNDTMLVEKEFQRLQKVVDQLNYDLERKNQLISSQAAEMLALKQTVTQTNNENVTLKEKVFFLTEEAAQVDFLRKDNQRLKNFFEKKIHKIQESQKKINLRKRGTESSLKVIPKMETFNSADSYYELEQNQRMNYGDQLKAQLKVDQILNFLYNIDQDAQIQSMKKLFDQEQLKVFIDLKSKFTSVVNQKSKNSPDAAANNSQEKNKTTKSETDKSIKIFADSRNAQVSLERSVSNRTQQTLNQRLLSMELEKYKQIEKISEIKNKLFCVRNIILNLLKSLDLKNIKKQTKQILDVLYDLFEYSETEKDSISEIKKKRGFFDFM